MKVSGIRIVIMCKAPVAGEVKTRLTTKYSKTEAARLHEAMATTVIERAKRLFDDVVIAADDPNHSFFASFGLAVISQGEGSLGARMQTQVLDVFADGVDAVLLLGTDSPHMSDERLLSAVRFLASNDVVIGPVEDGGYELIAMKEPQPLFDDVEWSSSRVLEQTEAHLNRKGLSCRLLEIGFDIDEPDDIERAAKAGWSCQL